MTVLLTADLCARAIIAAARSYGDDPLALIETARARGATHRRSMTPAALALVQATGFSRKSLCQILDIDYFGLSSVPKKPRSAAAWQAALLVLGVDPETVQASKFGPKAAAGTVVAPPPVAQETTPAPVIDHRPAIAEALARRRARGDAPAFSVAGVEADKALIGATEPGGCVWPMGDPREPGYRSCQAAPLSGRLYCAEHLKKAGMKPVAKVVQTVGRVAESYVDREAG